MGPPRTLTEDSQGVTKFYLIIYNALQTMGWTILLVQLLLYYISSSNNSLYDSVKWPLIISQSAAVVEVAHALVGITPSNPIFTSIQVFLRIALICGIIPNVVGAQKCSGFPIAVLAWSITEIVRYAYYTLNLVNMVPYNLMWLRYSTFIVLYPVGSIAEFNCLYAAQKQLSETGLMDYKPANSIVLFLLLLPIVIHLYNHMLVQRNKVLGAPLSFNLIKSK